MAFDGIAIAAVTAELKEKLTGGRLYKIAQTEKDELMLTVKTTGGQYRLLISVNPSLPLIYITDENKQSPITAPSFCMLLRKHLQNAKIVSFAQPDFERIVRMELEHVNEMGDLCRYYLIVELMGRYSNIIFTDDKDRIIDSIRHVSGLVSSVRQVLPGRDYFLPNVLSKKDPTVENKENFLKLTENREVPVFKAIYTEYTGIAPIVAKSICTNAGIPLDMLLCRIEEKEFDSLWNTFRNIMDEVKGGIFYPAILMEDGIAVDISVVNMPEYKEKREFENASELLCAFFSEKNVVSRIKQKSFEIRRIVSNAYERTKKKIELQEKQLEDTNKKDKYRLYGELLNTYGYSAKPGDKSIEVLNYYDNSMLTIPLDPMKSATDNAKAYFAKYGKLKRTLEAVTKLLEENRNELLYLDSVLTSINIARSEDDLVQIKEEIIEAGLVRRRRNLKKPAIKCKPYHYTDSLGYEFYVGKNNIQNDEITFRLSSGKDIWFHVKKQTGSHVLVKYRGEVVPDKVYAEAAGLAAYYSSARENSKVEVDYTEIKNVKKPQAANKGFVIYHTNYSMVAEPVIDTDLKLL